MSPAPGSPPVTVGIVHPAPARSHAGNRVTALRWAVLLRELDCKVFVEREWSGRACDALIALHAGKSVASIRRFRSEHPRSPLIVGGAGTDIYGDDGPSAATLESLEQATYIVVLQPRSVDTLPPEARTKARVIFQSVRVPAQRSRPDPEHFDVAVIANLREVKDPLRTAFAVRLLPARSRVRVFHVGSGLDPELETLASHESETNPRYTFLGPVDHAAALQRIARSRLVVLSSRHEGGANVLSEALALGVPALCSAIPGSTGIIGEDYPGLFPSGDERALAALIERAETEDAFLERLTEHSAERAWIADPARERESWRDLLREALPDRTLPLDAQ